MTFKVNVMKKLALFLAIAASPAISQFMPTNDLHLEPNLAPTMDEKEFDAQIDKAIAFFGPILKKNFGATLIVNRYWNDEKVNAYAYQTGDRWYLSMFGGLARRVTADGFMAVIMHELGHHVGGFPFTGSYSWAAAEGQSDYFATGSGLTALLAAEDSSEAAKEIPEYPKAKCDAVWAEEKDKELCYRIMLAGKSLGDLLSRGTAKWDTPDKSQVAVTDVDHPAGQCRLDTYMAAAVCVRKWDFSVIPGKDLRSARNSVAAEKVSAKYTCMAANGDKVGLRPACWFKSQLK